MDAGFACGRVFNAEDTNRDGKNLWSAFPSHCNNGYFGDAYGRDDADTENQDEKPDMAFIPANFETLERASLVHRGIEGRVPHKGILNTYVYLLVGVIWSAMGYCGTPDIGSLRRDVQFVRMSSSGYRESHPHDIDITEEAPNYTVAYLNT